MQLSFNYFKLHAQTRTGLQSMTLQTVLAPTLVFRFKVFGFQVKQEFGISDEPFLGQNSFWLHCRVYMCHSVEDCLQSCAGSRRRRSLIENELMGRSDEVSYQENGLPVVDTLSSEIFVTDVEIERLDKPKAIRIASRVSENLSEMQNNFKAARKAVKNLANMIAQL